jgi:hypothetical protein
MFKTRVFKTEGIEEEGIEDKCYRHSPIWVLPCVDLTCDLIIIGSLTTKNGVHGRATNILGFSCFPSSLFLFNEISFFYLCILLRLRRD